MKTDRKTWRMATLEAAVATILALAAAAGTSSCSTPQNTGTVLFSCENTDSIPYRIPAIAQTSDGTLIAVADYRHCRNDIGFGRVDLHYRLSADNGGSWGDERILVEGSGTHGATDCGYGDAAIAARPDSGEVLLLSVCGETIYWHQNTCRSNPNRFACIRSFDNGGTWTAPVDITEDIYSLFDAAPDGCVQSSFAGSGRICVSRYIKTGDCPRIYVALTARPNGNRVIYSDDFGRGWKVLGELGQLPAPDGNEPKCAELPDGSVILSSRAEGGRYFNIYRYSDSASGAGGWEKPAFSGAGNCGCTAQENSCNGEILTFPAYRCSDATQVELALQSVPFGPGRSNVGVYYKEIEGGMTAAELAADWKKGMQISDTDSAYSTMILQQDGRIGFYYEEELNYDSTGYEMVYKSLTLEDLTSGEYMTL